MCLVVDDRACNARLPNPEYLAAFPGSRRAAEESADEKDGKSKVTKVKSDLEQLWMAFQGESRKLHNLVRHPRAAIAMEWLLPVAESIVPARLLARPLSLQPGPYACVS